MVIADVPEAGTKEFFSSWALFIMIMLLMCALFTSYILQQKKIQAVHETVLSIFAGECAVLYPIYTIAILCGMRGEADIAQTSRHVRRIDYSLKPRVAYPRQCDLRLPIFL